MNNKEFDRSICFTFFEDYRLTAKDIEKDFGKEVVADYYNAIIDYALYNKEPELNGIIKYLWHTTKTTIDKSVERRAGGFAKENIEQTEAILKYKEENPNASQRKIAAELGISVGKVNKVLKNNSITNSDTITSSTSTSNTTMNVNVNTNVNTLHDSSEKALQPVTDVSHPESAAQPEKEKREKSKRMLEDLTDKELIECRKEFKKQTKYNIIKAKFNLNEYTIDDNTDKTIDSILKERKSEKRNILLKDGSYLSWTKEELFNILTDNGTIAADDIEWELVEENYINSMNIEPTVVKNIVKEFKEKLCA